MCLDHPERVLKVSLIDGLPTYHVWTNTSREWALNSWHWLFLAQPEPFPETLISSVPAEWYLRNRGGSGLGNLPKPVFDEFIRCYTPKTIKGTCHDYRANARIDFEMDAADKDKQIATPLLILWGTRGGPATDEYPTVWREICEQSRVGGVVQLRPLSPLGRGRSGLRPLHEILRRLAIKHRRNFQRHESSDRKRSDVGN